MLSPVPFNEANAYDLPLATVLQQQSGLGKWFGPPCESCSRVCVWDQGASHLECLPFRNAVGRAAKAKSNNHDSSKNFAAAEMSKYNGMFITSLAGILLMPAHRQLAQP